MADYNPKTVAAYQQYASSMKAGGGGTNLSGSGAKAPPKMQTEYGNRKGLGSPTSRLDKKGYTPTTSLSTASGIEYIDNVSSEKDLPSANPAAILYSAAANANMAAGVTQTPSPLTPMNGMSLYSMKKMTEVVPQVTPYLYRVDMQEQAQDLVEQAMGYEPPLAQMTPDRRVWDYEKYSSLSSEEKDKAAEALQIVGERKMTPSEIKQFQPLIDMANEIANETITVEELAPLTQMDQEAKLKDILEVIESGGLNRITNIREVRSDNAVDPFTGLPFGDNELGFTDISPSAEAEEQQGLMSRSRVPTGSIEEAVREAYNLEEEPAVEAEAPAETTTRINDVVDTALTKLSDNTSMSKSTIVDQVTDLVGRNIYAAAILGAFEKESGRNFTSREENLNYSLANARAVPFSKTKIDNALNSLSEADRAKVEAGRNVEAFGKALMDESYSGGSDYKGRGLIHITHDYNYEAVGDRIGVDLVSNPELVNDPKYAVPAALAYLDLQGYFDQEPTKNSLHRMINPQASRTIKNQRWSAANRYLEQIRDEGGSSDSSPRPTLRPTD